MSFHIGKLIKKQLDQVGMTKSEFARRIQASPQNIHYILKRQSLDTDLLQRISRTLNYDFFQHYMGLSNPGSGSNALLAGSTLQLKQELVDVKEEIAIMSRHNSYLREIVELIKPVKESSPKSIINHQLKPHVTKTKKKKAPVRRKK